MVDRRRWLVRMLASLTLVSLRTVILAAAIAVVLAGHTRAEPG